MKKIQLTICATAILLLGLCNKSVAQSAGQERQYTQQREAARIKTANEASIQQNAVNNRPFESKWGSATGALGTVKNRYEISPARQAELRAINERSKAEWDRQLADAKRYQAAIIPFIAYFQESGLFDAVEARSITFSTLSSSGSFGLEKFGQFHLNAVASYKEFNAKVATAGFDELAALALNFCVKPAASIRALQSLFVRFPERQQDIDMALISALQGQYGSKKFYCRDCHYEDSKKMDSLFFTLARKYPQWVGAAVDSEYTSDGYQEEISAAQKMGKKGEARLFQFQEEYLALPAKDIRDRAVYCKEFLAAKGLDYISAFAQKWNLKPLDILLAGYKNEDYFVQNAMAFRQVYSSIYKVDAKDPFSEAYAAMIYKLAVDGVPEAMNVYALRTAQGWTKDDAANVVPWLRKAVAAGSADAKKNLDNICGFTIKGMNKKYCDKNYKLKE